MYCTAAYITKYTARAAATPGGAFDFAKVCATCGEKGHLARDKKCTKECDECGSKMCPKIRGGKCVVYADEMPTKADIPKALGIKHDMPDHVYDLLKKLRETKRAELKLDSPAGTIKVAASTSMADADGYSRFTMM